MSTIKSVEMRWVTRSYETREPSYWGGSIREYHTEEHEYKVLQYRQYREPSNMFAERGWTEWEDVPDAEETD